MRTTTNQPVLTLTASAVRCGLLAATLLSGSALHAQSVQIYGLIDVGVEYMNSVGTAGSSLTRMPGNTAGAPSRLGFRGTEDLGQGLKAGFTLESGLAMDTGGLNQGGRLFGRQAFVSLAGDWGQLALGRQYTMTFYSLLDADVLGASAHGLASLDSYLPNARADNALGYRGKWGNLSAGATYSTGRDTATAGNPGATNCAGESSTDTRSCREWSAMLKYDTPGWGLAWAQDVIRGGAGAFANLTSSTQTDTRVNLNGWVRLGEVKLGAGVLHRRNDGSATTPRSDIGYLGASAPLNTSIMLDAQVAQLKYKDSSNKALQAVLRGTWSLSKRTAAYVSLARLDNSGTLAVSVSNGAAGGTPAAGGAQTGVMAGLRHSF
jgi:predicted porin